MGRKSSIARLPPEIRDWIGRLFSQGRTLDEILLKLRELDVDQLPSRSALHRHLQRADKIAEQVKRSRVIAEVMARNLGEDDDNRLARGNIELLHSIVMSVGAAAVDAAEGGDGRIDLSPQEIQALSKSLDHLGKASTSDVARTIAIEKRAAEKARREVASAVEAATRDKGLSAETNEAIKAAIFGLTK